MPRPPDVKNRRKKVANQYRSTHLLKRATSMVARDLNVGSTPPNRRQTELTDDLVTRIVEAMGCSRLRAGGSTSSGEIEVRA